MWADLDVVRNVLKIDHVFYAVISILLIITGAIQPAAAQSDVIVSELDTTAYVDGNILRLTVKVTATANGTSSTVEIPFRISFPGSIDQDPVVQFVNSTSGETVSSLDATASADGNAVDVDNVTTAADDAN